MITSITVVLFTSSSSIVKVPFSLEPSTSLLLNAVIPAPYKPFTVELSSSVLVLLTAVISDEVKSATQVPPAVVASPFSSVTLPVVSLTSSLPKKIPLAPYTPAPSVIDL